MPMPQTQGDSRAPPLQRRLVRAPHFPW